MRPGLGDVPLEGCLADRRQHVRRPAPANLVRGQLAENLRDRVARDRLYKVRLEVRRNREPYGLRHPGPPTNTSRKNRSLFTLKPDRPARRASDTSSSSVNERS